VRILSDLDNQQNHCHAAKMMKRCLDTLLKLSPEKREEIRLDHLEVLAFANFSWRTKIEGGGSANLKKVCG
jgi:hypothetical protein